MQALRAQRAARGLLGYLYRPLVTTPAALEKKELNISDHIRKQILQAGLHYLTDEHKLRENIANRNSEADVDELVNTACQTLRSKISTL